MVNMFLKTQNMYHFYHIYADGQWQRPLGDHIKALKKTELINFLEPIKFGIVGSDFNLKEVINFIESQNINYEIVNHQHYGWEQVTQNKIYEFAQDNNGLVFYAHTKASYRGDPGQHEWRETMTYYNVVRWKECIDALNDHDTAGCFWMTPLPQMTEHSGHKSFYAGTFWWTTLNYIRKLPAPNMEHRYRAEGWIGLANEVKPFSFAPGWPGNWIELSPYINN
jgi:hypothetical protein